MLIARSAHEAHLYMDLRVCACGANQFDRQHRLEDREGILVSVYEGTCPQCGRIRSYEFTMPDGPMVAPPAFGGPEPSQIIDPGEFMWASDRVSRDSGLRMLNTPKAEHREFRPAAAYAIAALEEVAKFLPEGAEAIPEELFTSERGREIYAKNPMRFKRKDIADSLERKQRILAGIDRYSPPQG
ncbi:hypothetical protein [Streptomyces sp. NBC_01565]|uniref:hypothetical protein n=1 Tax=unclassified Streptomyces TaxID=2593676 RepID=UPI002254BF2E|nr:hypothetical protein [Streptomyces sp. NBC_01565]MCX4545801.1 hypothetical protein [Streptomyces sp. NBC_01565]